MRRFETYLGGFLVLATAWVTGQTPTPAGEYRRLCRQHARAHGIHVVARRAPRHERMRRDSDVLDRSQRQG